MAIQPIFILGPHKSGTSLLRNLFDDHSELFVCPVETHFFQLMGKWVDYDLRKRFPEKLSRSEVIDVLTKKVQHFNVRENALGDSDLREAFDEEAFVSVMEEIHDGTDERELIECYFRAIHYSLFKEEMTKTRVVHKTVGLAEHAIELKKLFPEAHFIHVVRNPYANLVAFRKFRTANGPYPLIDRLMRSLSNNFYFLYKNQQVLSNYHVLRYEDLVDDPRGHLKDLCERIGISFEEKMLTPTSLGKTWGGNSTSQGSMKGIRTIDPERWKNEVHPMEAWFINNDLPFVLRDYSYPSYSPKGFWKPAPKEGMMRYFYNRIYRFYDRKYLSSK